MTGRSGRRLWAAAAAPIAAGLALAGCGSSGGTPAASGGSAGSGGSGGGAAIATATGPEGTYLTDGSGRALYLWVADTGDESTCTGACAGAWPPLVTKGAPTAAGGVRAAELGTTTRSDGAKQVTYDGHPLYYYAGDSGANQTNGQGSDGFGAKWWLVAPSGTAITDGGPPPGSPSSGSSGDGSSGSSGDDSGGGYGY